LPQGVAIPELDGDDISSADKTELAFDAELLLSEGPDAGDLKRFTAAPLECLVQDVEVSAANTERLLIIRGELANIEIQTSLESGQVAVRANAL
jgi:hypothetical protein